MPDPARPLRFPVQACLLALLLTLLPGEAPAEPLDAPPSSESPAAETGHGDLGTSVMVPRLLPTSDATPDARELPKAPVEEIPTIAVTPPEPLEPPPLKPVEIMLDWYPGPQHAALLVAYHKGIYRRLGLEVTLSTPADPALPARLLAAGRIELAVSRQPLLHLLAGRGLPLVRVGTLVDLPLGGLLVRNGSDTGAPFSLAGKRIGYSTEEARELLLPTLLRPHGVGVHELELVDINFGAVNEVVEQALDGIMTPQRLTLPHKLGDKGIGTRLLRLEEHGVPPHEGLILLANRDRIGGQRETLRRVLEALTEATAWLLEEPDAAWELLQEQEPALDTPANRDAWLPMLLRLSARPAALDLGNYQRFEEYLVAQGLAEHPTPAEKLALDLWAP